MSDSKTPFWTPTGHHYRITISRPRREGFDVYLAGKLIDTVFAGGNAEEVKTSLVTHDGYEPTIEVRPRSGERIVFDFWGSAHDAEAGENPDEYDVLACLSGDVYCPEDFKEFCGEYGYEEDSIKALQTFKRADRFGKRLRTFFSEKEIEQLSEIR